MEEENAPLRAPTLFSLTLKALVNAAKNGTMKCDDMEIPPELARAIYQEMKLSDVLIIAGTGAFKVLLECLIPKAESIFFGFGGGPGTLCVIKIRFVNEPEFRWEIINEHIEPDNADDQFSFKIGGHEFISYETSERLDSFTPDYEKALVFIFDYLIKLFRVSPEDVSTCLSNQELSRFLEWKFLKTCKNLAIHKSEESSFLDSVLIERGANNLNTILGIFQFIKPVQIPLDALKQIEFYTTSLNLAHFDTRSIAEFCKPFLYRYFATRLELGDFLVYIWLASWTSGNIFEFKTNLNLSDYNDGLVETHLPHFEDVPETWSNNVKFYFLSQQDCMSAIVFSFRKAQPTFYERIKSTIFWSQAPERYERVIIYRWPKRT